MLQFVLSLIFTAAAFAHDCTSLLESANHRAVVKQVLRLNPEIQVGESPAELFLALRVESLKRVPLPEELVRHLRIAQARHFAVETLDVHTLTIFYHNALRALEQRAAVLWREQEITALMGPLPPDTQKLAGHLLDSFFSPNNLNDEALTAEEAERYFRERPWRDFNWTAALAQDFSQFDWNDTNRIKLALSKNKRAGECCLSQPGCTLCPHNRAWLKP